MFFRRGYQRALREVVAAGVAAAAGSSPSPGSAAPASSGPGSGRSTWSRFI